LTARGLRGATARPALRGPLSRGLGALQTIVNQRRQIQILEYLVNGCIGLLFERASQVRRAPVQVSEQFSTLGFGELGLADEILDCLLDCILRQACQSQTAE
jgi:hypothetical protein